MRMLPLQNHCLGIRGHVYTTVSQLSAISSVRPWGDDVSVCGYWGAVLCLEVHLRSSLQPSKLHELRQSAVLEVRRSTFQSGTCHSLAGQPWASPCPYGA